MLSDILNCLKTGNNAESSVHLYKQAIAIFASSLLCLSGGITGGITAVLLPKLEEDEQFYWTNEYGSWIASIAPISSIFSCLCIGSLLDRFGRKWTHIILSFPFIFGWLCMAFANNFYVMLMGRFLTGLSFVAARFTAITYLGEISDPKDRGIILLFPTLSMNLGVLFSHIICTLICWRTALLVCILPNLILLAVLFQFKESPYWLISKGRTDEAIQRFRWFRGIGELAENELRAIIEKQKSKGTALTRKELMSIVCGKSFLRPTITLFFIFAAIQFNGVNTFTFYAKNVIQTMFKGEIDTFLVLVITDLIRVGVSIILCLMGKNMHRRVSFLYCSYATVLLLVGLVLTQFFEGGAPFQWIPLTLVLFYTGVASSMSNIGWTFVGELFPTNLRGLGSGLASTNSCALLSLCVKINPDLLSHGEPVMYGTFAIITLVCTVTLHFILPDTQGKSLKEIQDSYANKVQLTTL